MKKKFTLFLFSLFCVLGAWAQLTSISDGGFYSIQMARTNSDFKLGVTSELKHADQSNPVVAGVFQISKASETNHYYIKECSSGKYVYADRTENSTSASTVAIKLGATTLPSSTTSETKLENLNYYDWIITYVGTKGTYATNAWTIVPSQSTSTQWAVYSQTAENPVAFFNRDDGNGYYIWGFVQFLNPTVLSSVLSKLTFKQIKDLGYTVDQITTACRPSTLDAPGWPSTTTYNTFKSTVEGLTDGDLVFTSYNNMWNARLIPTGGHFYRLKGSVSNKYLKGAASTTGGHTSQWLNATNQDGAQSIFYYDTDKTLISYTNGRGFTGTHSIANVGVTGNKFTFEMPYNTFVVSRMYGSLSAKSDASGVGQYLYSHTGSEDYVNRNGGKAFETNWTVEEVTSLPITMHEVDGAYYGTINFPVAVTIPSGLSAYSATASDGVMTLTKVVENGVLAKNTPVILYSKTDVTSLTVSNDTGSSPAGTNELSGTTAAISVTANQNYVLNNGTAGVGFYLFNGTVMPGFKAYLTSANASVRAFTFSFEDAEDAIRAIESENSGLEIYDISGRRVQKAQKGLYIVNGKKVMYK